jgi:arsenate reductase
VKVELLFFDGCPHVPPARTRLEHVLARLAPGTAIEPVRVDSERRAQVLGFPGSPTIRVDGLDVEGEEGREPAMACRLYEGGGPPPEWMIEAAVLGALRPRHLLFMCVANSARSQLAEGIARSLAPTEVTISSAGSSPTAVRPEAVAVLREIGVDITGHQSKSVDDLDAASVDALVTLCADEVCPTFSHPVLRLAWPLADPAAVDADGPARLDAFRNARNELQKRLRRLLAAWSRPSPSRHAQAPR